MSKKCPCGTGRSYSECCEPYITGMAKPPTAESLMRSRYSAYTEHAIDYIVNTCYLPDKKDIDRKSTSEWSEQSTWLGLKIIAVEKGGITDTEGTVEFEAAYERNGLKDVHHEKAHFIKDDDEWFYEDGNVITRTVVRTSPKVGRNDVCPCGSGKKFKHCCINKF
ncbi:MAG: YchJ family protein [Treponema sp.]|nr:YchJ family protein [Treponema sp.]